jgi:hypothetical protein
LQLHEPGLKKRKKRITRRRAGTKERVVNRDFSTDTGDLTQSPFFGHFERYRDITTAICRTAARHSRSRCNCRWK